MEKCSCWQEKLEKKPLYDRYTGEIEKYYTVSKQYCTGTRECDECKCNGDELNCTFYPEVIERAKANRKSDSKKITLKYINELKNEIYKSWGTDPQYFVGDKNADVDAFARRDCELLEILQKVEELL